MTRSHHFGLGFAACSEEWRCLSVVVHCKLGLSHMLEGLAQKGKRNLRNGKIGCVKTPNS
jgi:hypothetical protein